MYSTAYSVLFECLWKTSQVTQNCIKSIEYSPNEGTNGPQSGNLSEVKVWHLLLYYTNRDILLSWLKPHSSNKDTIDPNRETIGWQTPVILSWLGDTYILIETLFSQWGYQYTPIGKPLGDNDTFYTIPIGRYFYPDWNPIHPMRIPIYPNRETLGWQWHLLYYPDWGIRLSWLKPYSPNEDTNRPQLGNPWVTMTPFILSRLGDTFILIETVFSQWGYQ